MEKVQQSINIYPCPTAKPKPGQQSLGFGVHFTDRMFLMDYSAEQGWHDPRIVPYEPLQLDPASMVFHYGQSVFEGLKAYRTDDNKVFLFRPDKNAERMNRSCDRLNIPRIDESLFVEAVQTIVRLEANWIPVGNGASLYIRPFIIATEAALGVRASNRYLFAIILSPAGAYFGEGLKPVRIFVDDHYVRAVRGGTGHAKTPGNYAATLKAQTEAKERQHCSQVLWLDGIERTYIEEVGSMNVFFKINGEVLTPELNGSILEGITRNSVIRLLKQWGIPVTERKIAIDEIVRAAENGGLEESFGTGTAAVISPIGGLFWNGNDIPVNQGNVGSCSQKLYDTLTGIQYGRLQDEWGWTVEC
ncbi:branched-chain amino acid aminotransferase [Paenibacillus piri]|uniref:Branched-chain-amino-acid aminotransferase n=2 Tax=Paenibacillus piri TaxID=2547395 RepID=A0A4R5KQY8_9BACL|nr:branched-chain amino acid aminotransferase [Paenibacillus piri]